MRPIKFRAWDKKEKIMLYDIEAEYYSNCDEEIDEEDETIPGCFGDYLYYDRIKDDFIVMQYTGVKDKNGNGKEIYEGDILKINDGVEFRNLICYVIYDSCAFRDSYYKWTLYRTNYTTEIIGNIYANPDLLDITIDKKKLEKKRLTMYN